MEHPENANLQPAPKINYTTEYVVVAGYVFFFCALITACVGFTYLNRAQFMPAPTQVNEFALGLPALTPTAHVLTTSQFPADAVIFRDDFVSNDNGWLESDDDTYETLEDSRLFFHSRYEDGYGIITCKECPSLETPFYFEASLATNKKTGDDYGLVFKHSYTFDDFFIFVITPESQKYALWHHTSDDWSLRLMGESSSVLPYPESNVLGVYANGERLELYINGEIVDTYAESNTSFHGGFWGLYMDNSSFGVHVDDLVIYKVEN